MKELKLNILCIIYILASFCSCNYHYYTVTYTDGTKGRAREYKSYDLQQRYYDKMFVKNYYKRETYFIDSTCISKTDTLVDCDSIKIFILPDSKEYVSIFTKGIVSCKNLSHMYGAIDWPLVTEIKTGKIIPPPSIKTLIVRDMQTLNFIKNGYTRKTIKFKITPYTFYIELTNEHANKKTKINDFINGAHLTWFKIGLWTEI